jgi:hypothetical protein
MKSSHIFSSPLRRAFALTMCAGALTACCGLSAQPADGHGGPRKPPAEALDACKSLSSGQACNFSSPQGAVKGTCWAPEGKPLACKPKDAPAGNPGAPKP